MSNGVCCSALNVVYSPGNSCYLHILLMGSEGSRQVPALPPRSGGLVSPRADCPPAAPSQARGLPGGGRNELPLLPCLQTGSLVLFPPGLRPPSSLCFFLLPPPPFIVMRVFKHSSFQTKRERKQTYAGPRGRHRDSQWPSALSGTALRHPLLC